MHKKWRSYKKRGEIKKERANKICGSMTGGINIVNQQKS